MHSELLLKGPSLIALRASSFLCIVTVGLYTEHAKTTTMTTISCSLAFSVLI